LAAALEGVHPFFRGQHSIAIKIRSTLLEFGEILDRLQGPLRAKEPLNVQATQRYCLDAVAEPLGAGIGREVRGAVLVAVRMAIKASRTLAGYLGTAIVGCVELLLWKGRQQQAQPFQLSRGKNAVEQLVVIGQRDQLALRDIAQIGAWGQIHRRRKLGQEVIRQIKIQIEPLQVSAVLLLDRVDQEVRKDKAALGMVGVRQGIEPLRIEVLVADLVWAHRGQPLPGHPGRQFDANSFLQRFAAVHRDTLDGAVAQIVALVEQRVVRLLDARLGGRQSRKELREGLGTRHRHVAGQPTWSLIETLGPHQIRVWGRRRGLCLGCGLLGIDVTDCQDYANQRENDQTPPAVCSDHGAPPLSPAGVGGL